MREEGPESRVGVTPHSSLLTPNSSGFAAGYWLSEKEHKGNALAPGAEEGRDKLRKATGSGKYASIRRFPNGETHTGSSPCIIE